MFDDSDGKGIYGYDKLFDVWVGLKLKVFIV